MYKISFCTVSMNRLGHIEKTLLRNLEDNSSYKELEVILLDYNSDDGLEEWVKKKCQLYLENGRLRYYKISSPTRWNPSHAKNVAFKLASGDVICNIWADYLTGPGFASYVDQSFHNNGRIVLTPINIENRAGQIFVANDSLGMVCVKKEDFLSVRGFDERMDIHGFEDYDFVYRLAMLKILPAPIDTRYLGHIQHGNERRYNVGEESDVEIYLSFINSFSTGILILLCDGTYEEGILIRNRVRSAEYPESAYTTQHLFEYSLEEGQWKKGNFTKQEGTIDFDGNPSMGQILSGRPDEIYFGGSKIYKRLVESEALANLLRFRHFYKTRVVLEKNIADGNWAINNHFGVSEITREID